MKKVRSVEFYKDHFENFFSTLPSKIQQKFIWTFQLIETLDRIPEKYLKYLRNDLFEIRVKHGTNIYRAFCFFDGNKMIIILNGFIKKTQKTPKNEIQRALLIKKEYEQEK